MIIPDNIAETVITLKDQFFDLRGLSAYSAMGVPTLRDYIRNNKLPSFKVRGKILIKKSEFDSWIENFRINKTQDLDSLVDEIMDSLKVQNQRNNID